MRVYQNSTIDVVENVARRVLIKATFWFTVFYMVALSARRGQSENTVANKYSGGCGAAILGLTACGASDGRETCGQEWQTYQIGFGDAALTPSVSCSASPKPCLCGAVCPRVSLPDGRSTPRLSIVRQLCCRFLGLTRMIEDGKIDHIRHVCP